MPLGLPPHTERSDLHPHVSRMVVTTGDSYLAEPRFHVFPRNPRPYRLPSIQPGVVSAVRWKSGGEFVALSASPLTKRRRPAPAAQKIPKIKNGKRVALIGAVRRQAPWRTI